MEKMLDPVDNRKVKSHPAPPQKRLDEDLLFVNGASKNLPSWTVLRDHLRVEGRVKKETFVKIIKMINNILSNLIRKRRKFSYN